MKIELFQGRRRLAAASLTAALGAVGIYGLHAQGKLPFDHPTPSIKMAPRSGAAAGRGYSVVVKRVLPA